MQVYEVEVYKSGNIYWHQNGELHRLDGPAIEYSDGDKSWYIEGKPYTEREFNQKINEMNGFIFIDGVKYQKVDS